MPNESITTRVAKEVVRIMEVQVQAILEIMPMPPGMEQMRDKKASARRLRQNILSGNQELSKMSVQAVGGPSKAMALLQELDGEDNA